MKKQIAVVTGASSGFGLLISLELAKRGYFVLATMRNIENKQSLLEQAISHGIHDRIKIHQLDVTCTSSIRTLHATLTDVGQVDVLVNNAGYALGGFAEDVTLNEYRKQFETNVFGAIAVTQIVLPFMRRQQSGTIINMSSISGKMGFPGLSPYVSSKHALEGWSESLRLEVKPFGIHVVLVEPGSYRTNIWSSGKKVADASLQTHSPYYEQMKYIEQYIEKSQHAFGDPQEVADKVADIAQKRSPSLRYAIGKGTKAMIFLKSFLPWKVFEQAVRKRLS